MLKGFIDDSGSDKQGPVYILTGYVSDADSWVDFTNEWKAALAADPGIEYFKMREAESGKGQFDGWERLAITAKIRVLIPIVNRYAQHRIECIFWQEHYDAAMKWFLAEIKKQMGSALDFSKIRATFEDPYFLAFYQVQIDYAKRLEIANSNETVDFVFDTQGKVGKNSVEWWKKMNESFMTATYQKYLPNEPIHRDDKMFLPLQAADLLAWQTRRRLYEYHVLKCEAKREEYEMLERVPLYPNRWNEERLKEFLGMMLAPVPGEEKLY